MGIHKCLNCGKEFKNNRSEGKYCSISCQQEYQSNLKYINYLQNQEQFSDVEMSPKWIKKHIIKEQHNKCSICGLDPYWNGQELHFILDHIDGNARNNLRQNLRLVCPNCDSQLDTYKSRNIGKCTRKYTPHKEAIKIKQEKEI